VNNEVKSEKHCGHSCMWFMKWFSCGLIDCERKACCCGSKRGNLYNKEKEFDIDRYYSSGDSDTEFSTPFNDLSTHEK